MKKIWMSIMLSMSVSLQAFATKPLEFRSTPKAVQMPAQNQVFLYYTMRNNTRVNLPLSYSFSSPSASIALSQSTCKNNRLPALSSCIIAVNYQSSNSSYIEPLTIKVYYQGRAPLVTTTSIMIDKELSCSLINKANWKSSFCQNQYQNALKNTVNVFNTNNINVQQEQTLGGMLGIYHHNKLGEQICYISCGQKKLNGVSPDEKTLFELASVSKLFTGSVLGSLVYTKKINPLSRVAPYLPSKSWEFKSYNLTANESSLTFQQLATFSGGVCFSDAPGVEREGTDHTIKQQTINQSKFVIDINKLDTTLSTCINEGKPQVKREYGESHYLPSHNYYSNSSVGLLAQILMNIDGYSDVLEGDFNGWLCNTITNVINMPMTSGCLPEEAIKGECPAYTAPHSSACNTALWQKGDYAVGYAVNSNSKYVLGTAFNYLPWAGAGGIRSNASDMINFIRANLNISASKTSSERALLQGMQIAHTASNYLPAPVGSTVRLNIGSQSPLKGGQGYAWVCEVIKELKICGKIGGHNYFRSFIGISKEQQYGLIILFNTGAAESNDNLSPIATAIPSISTIGVNMILNNGLPKSRDVEIQRKA